MQYRTTITEANIKSGVIDIPEGTTNPEAYVKALFEAGGFSDKLRSTDAETLVKLEPYSASENEPDCPAITPASALRGFRSHPPAISQGNLADLEHYLQEPGTLPLLVPHRTAQEWLAAPVLLEHGQPMLKKRGKHTWQYKAVVTQGHVTQMVLTRHGQGLVLISTQLDDGKDSYDSYEHSYLVLTGLKHFFLLRHDPSATDIQLVVLS